MTCGRLLLGLMLGGCLPCAAGAAELPTVEKLIARHIQATGGETAWRNISTQTRKGYALPDSANLPLESAAQSSGKWMFTIRLRNGAIAHGFDGTEGWESRGTPAKMERDAAFEEALIYSPFWIFHFKEHFPKATVRGIERNGEAEVYVVEASPLEGRTRVLYFDTRTGLLTRAGKVMYADYRDAGGVKAPFLVRYGFQTFKFSEIRHGEPVDEARFRMPPLPVKPEPAEPQQNLPAASAILDKYFAAVGGPEPFAKLKTQVRKGVLKVGNESIPVETFAKAPGKWLLLIHTGAGGLDREGFDGAVAWSGSSDVIKDMNPAQRAELESFHDFQLPVKLNAMRAGMTVKRQEKKGAQELWVLETPPDQGRHTVWFDAQTGLVARIDSVLLEDYREVDGMKVPFSVGLQGGQLPVSFTEIKHDAAIEDTRFARPAPAPSFDRNFAGLEDVRAVPVLKRVVGQGVSPSDGRMLYDLIVEKGYKRALDVGTARGYSSLWFALAMKKNSGNVVTIEIDPEVADEARENFRQAGLAGIIDSRINDALLEIPEIKGGFDFVFLDPGAPLNKRLFDLLQAKIAPGGTLAAHNAGSFQREQPDFLKAIESDPNLETKIVKTASGGISISVKKRN